MYCLLAFLFLCLTSSLPSIEITATDPQKLIVGAQGINFIVNITNVTLSAGNYFKVTYPTDFQLRNDTSFTCSFDMRFAVSFQCGPLSEQNNTIQFKSNNYVNPTQTIFTFGWFNHVGVSNMTENFLFQLCGDQMDCKTYPAKIALLPKVISNISLSISNYTTSQKVSLNFEFVLQILLRSSSYFKVTFPPLNPTVPIPRSSLPTNINGSFLKGPIKNATFSSDGNTLHIWILDDIEIAAGTIISFQIQDFLTANTVGLHFDINFYILDKCMGVNDSCYIYHRLNMTYPLFVPNNMKYANFSSSNYNVGPASADLNFTIWPHSFLPPNSSIRIIFPNDFSIPDLSKCVITNYTNINLTSSKLMIIGRTITLYHINSFDVENIPFSFTFANVPNPSRTQMTSSFQIILLDSSENMIERQLTSLEYRLNPRQISNFFLPVSYCTINSYCDLEIYLDNFELHDDLAMMQISFANIWDVSQFSGVSIKMGINPDLNYYFVNNTFMMANIFDKSTGDFVRFTLYHIKAPNFLVYTVVQATIMVAGVVFSTGTFPLQTMSIISDQVQLILYSEKPMAVTDYLFSIKAPIEIYSGLQIDTHFYYSENYQQAFLDEDNITAKLTIETRTYDVKLHKVNNLTYSLDYDLEQRLKVNTTFTLLIKNVQNPRVPLNTSYTPIFFYFRDTNAGFDDYLVKLTAKGLIVNITQPSDILNFGVRAFNPTINQLSVYEINFTMVNYIAVDDQIIIQLPSQIHYEQNVSIVSQQFRSKVINRTASNIAYVSSWDALKFNTSISLQIQYIKNPSSVQCVGPFNVTVVDNQTKTLYATYVSTEKFCDYLPKNISAFSVTFTNSFIGEPNIIILNVTMGETIPKQGSLTMTILSDLKLKHLIVCKSNIAMKCRLTEKNQMMFYGFDSDIAPDLKLEIQIQGFSNPSFFGVSSNQFILKSFNELNQMIAQSTAFLFDHFKCHPNCKTCLGNYTNCSECMQSFILLDSFCLESCPSNYDLINGECLIHNRCLTPKVCKTCDPFAAERCIECTSDYLLYQGYCFPNNSKFREIFDLSKEIIVANESNKTSSFTEDIIKSYATNPKKEITFFNTRYDNLPYISFYVILSFIIIGIDRFIFKNSNLNVVFCIIFLSYFLDIFCMTAVLIKFFFIQSIFYLISGGIVCGYHFLIHIFFSASLWSKLKKEPKYILNLGNACFKFSHMLTLALNYRFSLIFLRGFDRFGKMIFNDKFRFEILQILIKSLICNVIGSFAMISILVCFIVIRSLDNEEVPFFFFEYSVFLFVYLLIQIICIAQRLSKSNSDFKQGDTIRESSNFPQIPQKKNNIIVQVLSNLSSGKKNSSREQGAPASPLRSNVIRLGDLEDHWNIKNQDRKDILQKSEENNDDSMRPEQNAAYNEKRRNEPIEKQSILENSAQELDRSNIVFRENLTKENQTLQETIKNKKSQINNYGSEVDELKREK